MAQTGLAPIYRYYTADLLTGRILAEIPFRGVSYERAIKGAGGFQGTIPVIDATDSLDLYENTMPGNTAVYVVRNGVCVWGGIIWSRSYDVVGRVLSVSASEFTSYFYHRRIWKSWNHQYGATITVVDGEAKAVLDYGSASSSLIPGASIKLQFDDVSQFKYDGYYKILDTPTPTYTVFGIDNNQAISTVNTVSRSGNVVSISTDTKHGLSVNDKVNVDLGTGTGSQFNGTHVVTSVGGSEDNIFTYTLAGADFEVAEVSGTVTRPLPDGIYSLVTVSVRADTYDYIRSLIDSVFSDFVGIDFPNDYIEPGISYDFEVIQKEVEGGVATIQTAEPHDLAPGQAVQIRNVDTNFDGEYYVTEVRNADEFSYELGGYLAPTAVSIQIEDIERLSATDGTVTITTLNSHAFLVGQLVDIETGVVEGGVGPMLNGTFTISEVVSATKFKYNTGYTTTIQELVFDPANAYSESRRNLVLNPSFETNTTGWSATGSTPATISRVTSGYKYGAAALQVACDGTVTLQGAYVPTKISVSASTTYTYSVWFKGELGKYVQLNFAEYNSGSTLLSTTSSTLVETTGNWQRLYVTKQTSSTTATVEISIKNIGAVAHTFLVDGVLFEKSTEVQEYFDGATTATDEYTYSWAGTAHASASIAIHHLDIIVAEISANTVTLTSTAPPDYTVGNSITVSGVWPQISIAEKSFSAANSKATITTAGNHHLQVGDTVNISGLRDYSRVIARTVSGTAVTMWTNQSHNFFVGDVVTLSDMEDIYYLTNKQLSSNVVTLTTSVSHNIAIGNSVTVSGIYDTFDVINKAVTDGVATLTLSANHNFKANDSVSIDGISETAHVISRVAEAGLVTLTTDSNHNFTDNGDIVVSGLGEPFDGKFKILTTTDTRVVYELGEDVNGDYALASADGTITTEKGSLIGTFTLSAVTANTISFNKPVNDVPSQAVSGGTAVGVSPMNGTFTVTAKNTNTFSYALTGNNVGSTAIVVPDDAKQPRADVSVTSIHAGDRTVTGVTRNSFSFTQAGITNNVAFSNIDGTASVSSIFNGTGISITAVTDDTFTYTKTAPNNVLETPANSLAYVEAPNIYNGTFTITAVDMDLNLIKYAKTHVDMPGTAVQGYGTATVSPVAVVSSFGPFPGNADIGVDFSTRGYSGKAVEPIAYRGFELTSVGDALSKYSDSIDGFEYRIDCAYDEVNDIFTKTFVLIPIDFPNPPAPGEVSPLSRFGADKLVFEYPGNIINVSIDESAENSSTRFFALGENDLGPEAGPPFSVNTANGLLRGTESKRKWPLLDDDEKVDGVQDETVLYAYAQRYLNEARPPDAQISVEVNGSLQPVVGSYYPGDWCSLIVDDKFILQRLSSDLEPRDTVIVRKIDAIKVSVPDGTTFPEKVSLTLVPEWEVDKHA